MQITEITKIRKRIQRIKQRLKVGLKIMFYNDDNKNNDNDNNDIAAFIQCTSGTGALSGRLLILWYRKGCEKAVRTIRLNSDRRFSLFLLFYKAQNRKEFLRSISRENTKR